MTKRYVFIAIVLRRPRWNLLIFAYYLCFFIFQKRWDKNVKNVKVT